MTRLKWWMRTVGAFYLILSIINLPFVVAMRLPSQYPDLGVPVGSSAAQALIDTWFMFGLELGVIGAALVFFSRRPLQHLALVWTVIALELVRGIADDLYLIARGHDPVFYSGFALVHLAIITTGLLFARHAFHTSAVAAGGRFPASPTPAI